jgi:putative ABC transport system permease protein
MFDSLGNDVRFAVRTLRKDWGFSIVAVLTLALAIGANTAIFSVVDAVILRPLGYPAGDRLYAVHENVPKFANVAPLIPVNAMHYQEWVKNARSVEQMALLNGLNMSLTGAGDPERVAVGRVTPNVFSLLGAQARLGRVLLPGDDRTGHDRVVVLDARLWRSRFGADPHIVGKKIILDGGPNEIVGVLPDDFHFPKLSRLYALDIAEERPLIWRPMVIREDELTPMGDFNFSAIARLRLGTSSAQAVSEMDAILSGIMEKQPEKMEVHAKLVPLQDQITGKSSTGLRLMLAAVGAVLLIGCVNIANLMLARAANRRREVAIRRAVGASGARLFGQVLVEGLTLSSAGGALGIAVAWGTLRVILANLPADLPRADEIHLDWRVLLFTLTITVFAGLLFALLPAWRFTQTSAQEALRSGGRGATSSRVSGRLRSTLVAAEVGLSVICLIAGGLLLHSFVKLLNVDRGFQSEHVMTVEVSLPYSRYTKDVAATDFFRSLLQRTRALPGVESVGLSSRLPLNGEGSNNLLSLEGQNLPMAERPLADFREVSSDYFQTLGIPLRQGRIFEERDSRKQVLVSETTAARLWPGVSPLGRRLRVGPDNMPLLEVVGVVGDVHGNSLSETPRFMVYLPYWQREVRRVSLAVRTSNEPSGIAAAIRQAIHDGDAELPVPAFQTMDEIVAGSVAQRRFQMNLVLLFAGAAVLLASLGIYGVVSYTVTQRTNEIGIRMALGAPPGRIRAMVLRQGLAPVMAGLLGGVAGSLALTRVLGSLLFGVGVGDPLTIGGVALLLTAMAVAAIVTPARRAMRVEPSTALRYE